MPTLKRLLIFLIVCANLTACGTTRSKGIAIDVLCDQWRRSLPSRSRQDTEQTRREIWEAYRVYQAACDDEL
jgi:hypothetical protein